ncbi:UrcA family protein [Sphingomonas ginkgonis]|uniref:UrcA family protein n=1 Tax=Sphingomonas ginkgonis TaxID=2315330 RepID=A0A3R9X802_9SPHN|nr:UrcA family protein [Sphingomonas ginkgonis]RST30907.1 UrcA family protein [Sphingomonas ginkgonis]
MKTIATGGALLLAATLGTATIAAAQEVRSERVSYADLNLATPAGLKALHYRIDKAAGRICGSSPFLDGAGQAVWQACIDNVRASAKPQLALLIERNGKGPALASASLSVSAVR